MKKKRSNLLLLLLLFFSVGCFQKAHKIQPKVEWHIQDRALHSLPSPFPPLSFEEEKEDWGKEFRIAQHFAHDLDLYRTISTLKRAEILLPPQNKFRRMQIQYEILYCYFVGKKYSELVEEFEKSDLLHVDPSFPPFRELLIMLYESYRSLHKKEEQEHTFELIKFYFPDLTEKLLTSSAFLEADLSFLKKKEVTRPFVLQYENEKKSPERAQFFNALLPGMGYFYLGQKKTAITALLMNGLFIAATYEFFHRGFIAAGIITLSFEAGWYFGGIYGASEEAKFYNERIFEKNASPYMQQEKLFPLLMLRYGF